MEPKVLTVQEAADMLRVSHATVMRMIKKGTLRANKVEWVWRIPVSEVDRYLRVAGTKEGSEPDSPHLTAPAYAQ